MNQSLACGVEVTRRPDGTHAGVHGEDGSIACQLIQSCRNVLGMNRPAFTDVVHIDVEFAPHISEFAQCAIEMRAVVLALQKGKQRREGLAHIPQKPEVEPGAAPEVIGTNIHLGDLWLRRHECFVRKVGAKQQQDVAW